MKKSVSILISLALLVTLPIASAGFFDSILTGKVAFADTNVTATISSNSGPRIVLVTCENNAACTGGSAIGLTEGGPKTITFNLTVYDLDGATDINYTETYLNVTYTCGGQARNRHVTCTNITAADPATSYLNFTCPITFQYYDCEADWIVNATTVDTAGNLSRNDTTVAHINPTQSLQIYPQALSFTGLAVGATNQFSAQNSTINNTGNVLPTAIQLNSSNLQGTDTISSYILNASYFTATTSNSTLFGDICAATALTNYSYLTIGASDAGAVPQVNIDGLHPGQTISAGYCIPLVPNLPKGSYTTEAQGSWILKATYS